MMWFCYERNFAMRWVPVVYHDDRPKAPRSDEVMMLGPWPVPPECIGTDGAPMFGRLKARFPTPVEEVGDAGQA